MRLLLVEDDTDIRFALKSCFEAECFAVDLAEDGERGSFLARTGDYDIILLDYNLPRKNGLEVCREIRAHGKTVPIIMLTVQSEVASKVEVLNQGADDYVTKPYSFQELLARVRSVLRRPKIIQGETYTVDDLVFDTRSHAVTKGGTPVRLTRKEMMLLEYLLRNRGIVVTRGMLIEHIWDMHLDPLSNTIDTHILTLRKKLSIGSRAKLIHTIPGRGYKLDVV
ncbi:MAG: response regulator transcription factor [Patescibacteria group bacterium]|jgi:DNA-binding response OmpR family regulator